MYLLKITLSYVKPTIWRSIWIDENRPLEHLHYLIQFTFDWEESHLWSFQRGREVYDMPEAAFGFGQSKSVDEYTIKDLLSKAGDKILYTYDFGDNWEHEILLQKTGTGENLPHEPFMVEGAMNGALEDSGGPPGYMYFMKVLANPKHPEYEDLAEMVGEDYDPNEFDLDGYNEMLSLFDDNAEASSNQMFFGGEEFLDN